MEFVWLLFERTCHAAEPEDYLIERGVYYASNGTSAGQCWLSRTKKLLYTAGTPHDNVHMSTPNK